MNVYNPSLIVTRKQRNLSDTRVLVLGAWHAAKTAAEVVASRAKKSDETGDKTKTTVLDYARPVAPATEDVIQQHQQDHRNEEALPPTQEK